MSNKRYSIGEMAHRLGVAIVTLRRWDKEGKLKPLFRTIGGHRRYGDADLNGKTDLTVLYSRVSCHDQKPDLIRQSARLHDYAAGKGWMKTETISDLGSGLNFRKRGLLRLLDMILHRRMSRLVIENKDRLLRFGAELIFRLCATQGIEVVVVEDTQRNFEKNLARDVLEIITVFSSRLYGARSSKRNNISLT